MYGKYILFTSDSTAKIYRASDGRLTVSIALGGVSTGAFSSGSSRVYLGAANEIRSYRTLDGQGSTLIRTETGDVTLMASASNGGKIAYIVNTGGSLELVEYDTATNTEQFRAPLSAQPKTLQYTKDNSKIVVDGPDVYQSTTGALLLDGSSLVGPITLSRNGDFAYGRSAADGSVLQSRALADGSLVWSRPIVVPNYTGGALAINARGDRLLVPGRAADGKAGVWSFATSSGSFLGVATPSTRPETSTSPFDTVSIISAPLATNVVLAQRLLSTSVPYGIAEQFSLSNAGTFTPLQDLSTLSYSSFQIAMTPGNVGSIGAPAVAVATGFATTSTRGGIQLRNAATGQLLGSYPDASHGATSSDGLDIADDASAIYYIGDAGISAINTSTGAISTPVGAGSIAIDAVGNNTLYATTSTQLVKYVYTGGTLSQVASWGLTGPGTALAVNDSETFAAIGNGSSASFRRVNLSTGAMTARSTGGQPVWLQFSNDGMLNVGYLSSPTYMAIRKYDLSVATPAAGRLVSKSVQTPFLSFAFAVSGDGATFAFLSSTDAPGQEMAGDISVYSGVSGRLLSKFDNQQVGAGFASAALNSDGKTLVFGRNDAAAVGVSLNPTVDYLAASPNPIAGGSNSSGVIYANSLVTDPAGLTITLTSTNSAATVPATVTIPQGQKLTTFAITTSGVNAVTRGELVASVDGDSISIPLAVRPAQVNGISFNPNPAFGGNAVTGTVTLDGVAGPAGLVVSFSSSNSSLAAPAASVTVPASASTANFNITTTSVGVNTPVTITATDPSSTSVNGVLNLKANAIASITFSPASIYGGETTVGTITLQDPAPVGGATIALSINSAYGKVPANVVIPAGQTTGTFNVTNTGSVAAVTNVTVSGTYSGATQSGTFELRPPKVTSLDLSRTTTSSNVNVVGTVNISAPAPTGGLVINLSSDNAAATVPATVTIAAGQTQGSFTITVGTVGSNQVARITATRDTISVFKDLTVTPPR